MRTPQQALQDALDSGAVAAWINGKPFQSKIDSSDWITIEGVGEPRWCSPDYVWRPTPLTFPPPPEGCCYHNPDKLTPEQVGDGYRLLLESELWDRDEEKDFIHKWKHGGRWDASGWGGGCGSFTYRVGDTVPFHWDKPKEPEWTLSRELPGFRPLRDGEEWHRNDWKKEMLPEGWRPLLAGEKCDCEMLKSTWMQRTKHSLMMPMAEFHDHARTRLPLPDPPKMVPLEAGDIPLTSLIRNGPCNISSVVAINNSHVVSSYQFAIIPMDKLQENGWEIRRPGSTTWKKCEKEEEVKP